MSMKDISDRQVLLAVQNYQINIKIGINALFPYETLSKETGQCEKVCYRCMERAYERGLLECGVSLRTAWITEEGFNLLNAQPTGREDNERSVGRMVDCPHCEKGRDTNDGPYERRCEFCRGTGRRNANDNQQVPLSDSSAG